MALWDPPADLAATAHCDADGSLAYVALTWTNLETYTAIRVWRQADGGSWAEIDDILAELESYVDWTATEDILYNYKLKVYVDIEWEWSNEDDAAGWTASTADTCTITDVHTIVAGFAVTATDTGSTSDEASYEVGEPGPQGYEVTATDTVTVIDSYDTSLMERVAYKYYLADSGGEVYELGDDYKGDAGDAITAYWQSKVYDFTDKFPQSTWKTIDQVTLIYLDRGTARIGLGVSVDNGITWEMRYQTIGSGDGTIKRAVFYFMETGRFFNFKIVNSSTTEDFQFLALEIDVSVQGEYFSLS